MLLSSEFIILYRFSSCIWFVFIFITWKLLWLINSIIISRKADYLKTLGNFYIGKEVFFRDVINLRFHSISVRQILDKLDLLVMFFYYSWSLIEYLASFLNGNQYAVPGLNIKYLFLCFICVPLWYLFKMLS